ncbi:DNA-directed DNA/RNA polymerase mu-like isoform X2 [Saccostrea echinata]|uniref:DNA-directed DNA/RNA polymerase mu-like isoform X2 n=1 Tax=Saccostrea echinata TaxID=191078 RepID=UPI002A80E238|nr:DNA-directed DNA/RNA polymerase mu-like isoform X2 [Saccostrea echinata]
MADTEEVVVYIMPQKIQKQRLKHMKMAALKHHIMLAEELKENVTHIVTEYETSDQAMKVLKLSELPQNTHLLKVNWFTDSIKARAPVQIQEQHRIPVGDSVRSQQRSESPPPNHIPEFSCQRSTPLKHYNQKFCEALELLQDYAEMREGDDNYMRALAWRRASCVLKSLKFTLTNINQVKGAKDIGKHVEKVLQSILDHGTSDEVEKVRNDPWYQKMKIFTKVFGAGTKTAQEWIENGWSTIKEVQQEYTKGDWRLRFGLAFHDELMELVTRQEADNFTEFIKHESARLLPEVSVELCGGFRRGKSKGHDIDLLFTHPLKGKEHGFLPHLLSVLEGRKLILCGKWNKSTFTEEAMYSDSKRTKNNQLDHFEKWIGIIKFPRTWKRSVSQEELFSDEGENIPLNESFEDLEPAKKKAKTGDLSPQEIAAQPRSWIARRVDLIIAPYDQYFYSLVGWTGSKQFNRDIRTYAKRTHNYAMTSHGLYDLTKRTSLPAKSEKGVFDLLGVPYFPPQERNC